MSQESLRELNYRIDSLQRRISTIEQEQGEYGEEIFFQLYPDMTSAHIKAFRRNLEEMKVRRSEVVASVNLHNRCRAKRSYGRSFSGR